MKIIEEIPTKAIKIFSVIMVSFFMIVITGLFLIKQPDVIDGKIKIVATQQPVSLYSPREGEIAFCKPNLYNIEKGEVIAKIIHETPFESVLLLRDTLKSIQTNNDLLNRKSIINGNYYFGELNNTYSVFNELFEKYLELQTDSIYHLQKAKLFNKVSEIDLKIKSYQSEIDIAKKLLSLAAEKLKTDSVLYNKEAILKNSYDKSLINYYSELEKKRNLESNILILLSTKNELKIEINKLQEEKELNLNRVKQALFAQQNQLIYEVDKWMLNNAIISPVSGNLEISNFFENNQYVGKNTEIARILPSQNGLRGLVYYSNKGAGKIDLNSMLKIYLDDYPSFENGYFIGKLNKISSSAFTDHNGQSFYQAEVNIDLNDQPYFISEFNFQHNMSGRVEIMINKKRLIFQIFGWLDRIIN